MFKSRAKKIEEEAKKDPDYRPTEELEEEAVPGEEKYYFPKAPIFIIGALVVIIIVLLILIFIFKK